MYIYKNLWIRGLRNVLLYILKFFVLGDILVSFFLISENKCEHKWIRRKANKNI
jgi:hypothetical protein